VWLGAEAAGIRARPTRILAVVGVIAVMRDPLMVVMPGAWLSFGATLGILLCARRLVDAVFPLPPARGAGRWRSLLRTAAALGAATLAAESMLLPVGAWMFSRVSVAGVLLNLVAIPAMTVVQIAGILAMAPETFTWVHVPAAAATHSAATLLVESARFVDWVPWVAWRVPPPPVPVLVTYYVAVAVVLARHVPRQAQMAAAAVAGVMLVVLATGPLVTLAQPAPGTLRATILDVGQGEAVVLQFPDRHVIVIDAGPAGDGFDMGERVVRPALWALGARRVDSVVMTHAHADHAGGLPAVISGFGPADVWEGIPVLTDPVRQRVQDAARADRLIWRELRSGDRWTSGGATVEVLHPQVPDWERPRVRNDDSVVLRVRYGVLDLLLTGDIEVATEAALPLDSGRAGAVRILKVAHHGSRTSTGPALLDRYRPWLAVISAGRNNAFGHPAPDVVARLEGAGVGVIRTDRDGAVVIESDGTQVYVRTWTGRSWRAVVDRP